MHPLSVTIDEALRKKASRDVAVSLRPALLRLRPWTRRRLNPELDLPTPSHPSSHPPLFKSLIRTRSPTRTDQL